MARKRLSRKPPPPAAPAAKPPPWPKHVDEEADTEWKQWFKRIYRLRDEASERQHRLVYSAVEKDSSTEFIIRRASEPTLVAAIAKHELKRSGRVPGLDIEQLTALWQRTVGDLIGGETSVFAYKKGYLTIDVWSAPLLQEIRQFHQTAILHDLKEIWPENLPLVAVKYRLGKRSNR